MSIIRVEKDSNFSVISNGFLNDKLLTFKAKGLLAYLLTKPNHWKVNVTHLSKVSKDKKDAVYAMIGELVKAGYIKKIADKNPKGQFTSIDYIVFEFSPLRDYPETDNPEQEEPERGKPEHSKDSGKKKLRKEKTEGMLPAEPVSEKTSYQKFIDVYDEWFKKMAGLPPKIDGVAGKAAKSIIVYMRAIVKERAVKEGHEETEQWYDDKLVEAWAKVLEKWHLIEPYLQQKTTLVDISSKIQDIVNQIRNGNKKRINGQNNQGSSKAGTSESRVTAAKQY